MVQFFRRPTKMGRASVQVPVLFHPSPRVFAAQEFPKDEEVVFLCQVLYSLVARRAASRRGFGRRRHAVAPQSRVMLSVLISGLFACMEYLRRGASVGALHKSHREILRMQRPARFSLPLMHHTLESLSWAASPLMHHTLERLSWAKGSNYITARIHAHP